MSQLVIEHTGGIERIILGRQRADGFVVERVVGHGVAGTRELTR
jgi:hypothetical protein